MFGRLFLPDLDRLADGFPLRPWPEDPGVVPWDVCGRCVTGLLFTGEGVDTAGRAADAPGRRSPPGMPLLVLGRGGMSMFSRLDSWPALDEGRDLDLTFFPDSAPGTRLALVSCKDFDRAWWSSSTF